MPTVQTMQDRINAVTKKLAQEIEGIVFGEVQARLAQVMAGIGSGTTSAPKPVAPAAKPKAPVKKAVQKTQAKSHHKAAPKKAAKKATVPVKRDMTCRVPECKSPHRGPKYQFFCNEHYLSLSAEEKATITAAYIAKKAGKGNETAQPAAPQVNPATEPTPPEPPATPAG